MFGGRGRFSGSQARLASMAAHSACVAKACGEPGSRALVLGCDIEVLGAPVLRAPEHPFVRACLTSVEPIEASYEQRALEFAAHSNKLKLLCFAEEFDQCRSVLALQPSRTEKGNATAYPSLEPSRPTNVAHSYRMVTLAHDHMLEQAARTELWGKGPGKVSELGQPVPATLHTTYKLVCCGHPNMCWWQLNMIPTYVGAYSTHVVGTPTYVGGNPTWFQHMLVHAQHML